MLRHHPHELPAVALGHPVLRLDALAGGDARLEGGDLRRIVRAGGGRVCVIGIDSSSDAASGLGRNARPSQSQRREVAATRLGLRDESYTAARGTNRTIDGRCACRSRFVSCRHAYQARRCLGRPSPAATSPSRSPTGSARSASRHPKGNSLPGALLRRLAEAVTWLGTDPAARVIVLRSEGTGAFCAGASFDELVEHRRRRSRARSSSAASPR